MESKIYNAALDIIAYHRPSFEDKKKVQRLMDAKATQQVSLAHDNAIEGKNGQHTQTITKDGWYDCDCEAFHFSQRKPCKHLFAIAHGIVRDW